VLLALAALLLGLGWWSYSPGLNGGFLFDDFNNLDQLGAYGRVDNPRSLLLYLTSGSADPIGRPLSLLSFLIDAREWPADPWPFKRTNILLHLLNGVLLGWVLLRLGRRLGIAEVQARAAAMLGAGLWTLHPFLVSTTLYVVQREAMLPATFTLLGMLLWLEGGERYRTGRPWARTCLIAAAWGCTALAMLCKANGVLLPLLLAILEWMLPPAPRPESGPAGAAQFRRWRHALLGVPSLLLGLWLLGKLPAAFTGETYGRPWTMGQRLLSEARAVCDYLGALWIPKASNVSVFNDAFRASTGWLHPWSTLPAVAALASLLLAGFALRRRHPALAFAIAFYFAGQLLESTVIPLELYFEHRSYLPALPMFWPLALWLSGQGSMRRLRMAMACTLPVGLAVLCHARAELWGHPYEQALLLAQADPESPRAQANAAAYERAHGRPAEAARRLAAANLEMPDEVQIALNWVAAECELGEVTANARAAAYYALAHNRGDAVLVWNWLGAAIDPARHNNCKGLDLRELETMLQATQANPRFTSGTVQAAEFQQLEGRLALARGDGASALRDFKASLNAFPAPDRALLQAALLGTAGFPEAGLEQLRHYQALPSAGRSAAGMPALHLWLLDKDGYWDGEFTHLRHELAEDVRNGEGSKVGPVP